MSADHKVDIETDPLNGSIIIPISEWPVVSCATTTCDSDKRKHYSVSKDSTFNPSYVSSDGESSGKKLKKVHSHGNRRIASSSASFTFTTLGKGTSSKEIHDSLGKESGITAKIARWWRRKKTEGFDHPIPKCSPDSMLLHISRLPECRSFLQTERKRLLCLMELHSKNADLCAALASLDDYIGNFSSALNFITRAVQLLPDSAEHLWLREKISRQCQMLREQTDSKKLIEMRGLDLSFPTAIEVPRVSGKTLSVLDFQKKYLKPGRPVIITDVVSGLTPVPFDYSLVIEHAGSINITTKEALSNSVTWAKLENKRETTVSELIDGVQTGSVDDFLFDWSLPLHCPSLAGQISLPSYFKDNVLLQTTPGSLYRDSWPSLFIAPKGATTQLHVDAFHSHFWMALFQGEKRWTFFDQRDTALLYPRLFQSMDPVFEVDLGDPDLEKFPLLAMTRPQQCVLGPGELLFVPAGSPHYVKNLTPTLAISSNYVDHTNFHKVCEELRINALQNQRAKDLLEQLQDPAFLSQIPSDS